MLGSKKEEKSGKKYFFNKEKSNMHEQKKINGIRLAVTLIEINVMMDKNRICVKRLSAGGIDDQ